MVLSGAGLCRDTFTTGLHGRKKIPNWRRSAAWSGLISSQFGPRRVRSNGSRCAKTRPDRPHSPAEYQRAPLADDGRAGESPSPTHGPSKPLIGNVANGTYSLARIS